MAGKTKLNVPEKTDLILPRDQVTVPNPGHITADATRIARLICPIGLFGHPGDGMSSFKASSLPTERIPKAWWLQFRSLRVCGSISPKAHLDLGQDSVGTKSRGDPFKARESEWPVTVGEPCHRTASILARKTRSPCSGSGSSHRRPAQPPGGTRWLSSFRRSLGR